VQPVAGAYRCAGTDQTAVARTERTLSEAVPEPDGAPGVADAHRERLRTHFRDQHRSRGERAPLTNRCTARDFGKPAKYFHPVAERQMLDRRVQLIQLRR
jgi:hypothetical protein